MLRDLKVFFWLLKFGAVLNLYFFIQTLIPPLNLLQPQILIPAQILFFVFIYRCLFPVRYENNAVLHLSFFSSIFFTRLLATFSEIAFIYQISYILRLFNVNQVYWIDALSWFMVIQVVISQCFVWSAILTSRRILYFYEEIGWELIFIANTIGSIFLYVTINIWHPETVFPLFTKSRVFTFSHSYISRLL